MEYLLSCLENGNVNKLNIFKRCGAQSFIIKCKPNTQTWFTSIGFCMYQQAESGFGEI